ncbi:hypothetical protein Y032_0030g2226 [Ancylostoma ceylanicum]|uniref:Uncharacterized protein n=1 Tax=Ancylostoma ceylanicum TaxID=53326 RepID=A0A016US01_9BILA|nr:hypothetical protein Y032_0030g2226 [Ancylostoma ceylanicum]
MAEEDRKTITILLYRYDVPLINITYRNRKDLFRTFKRELRKHQLPIGEVSWADYENGDRSVIRNADDLFGAVSHCNSVKMYCRPKNADNPFFTPSNSDDDEGRGEEIEDGATSTCKKPFESANSAGEAKTATIKLYRDNLPRITISYKGKKDLFKKFQKKLKKLNLPAGEVYWGDVWEDERVLIENADDLFGFVKDDYIVKMYYRRTSDNELLACCSSVEDEEKDEGRGVAEENRRRNRSPSPELRLRRSSPELRFRRSLSAFFLPHSHPSYDQTPWPFAPWNFMMDPRFAPVQFPHSPHVSGKNCCHGHERSHRSRSRSLSGDLSKL